MQPRLSCVPIKSLTIPQGKWCADAALCIGLMGPARMRWTFQFVILYSCQDAKERENKLDCAKELFLGFWNQWEDSDSVERENKVEGIKNTPQVQPLKQRKWKTLAWHSEWVLIMAKHWKLWQSRNVPHLNCLNGKCFYTGNKSTSCSLACAAVGWEDQWYQSECCRSRETIKTTPRHNLQQYKRNQSLMYQVYKPLRTLSYCQLLCMSWAGRE